MRLLQFSFGSLLASNLCTKIPVNKYMLTLRITMLAICGLLQAQFSSFSFSLHLSLQQTFIQIRNYEIALSIFILKNYPAKPLHLLGDVHAVSLPDLCFVNS